tara:strand:- start:111 stop:626 length:516 start_codon:yes stop_codon:yes gene_type:complete
LLAGTDANNTDVSSAFEALIRGAIAIVVQEIANFCHGLRRRTDRVWAIDCANEPATACNGLTIDLTIPLTDLTKSREVVGKSITVIVCLIADFCRRLAGTTAGPTEFSVACFSSNTGAELIALLADPNIACELGITRTGIGDWNAGQTLVFHLAIKAIRAIVVGLTITAAH